MPPWISHITSAQKKEIKLRSYKWIQLATIGLDNTPRVRTVVFRGWSEYYQMKILTDSRSQKYLELESNKNVEICWLFTEAKSQFRLRGTVEIDKSIDTYNHWDKLDSSTKSMWNWPSPGKKIVKSYKENYLINENPKIVENFILLKINIFHVEELILRKPIHQRRRWILKNEWIEENINP